MLRNPDFTEFDVNQRFRSCIQNTYIGSYGFNRFNFCNVINDNNLNDNIDMFWIVYSGCLDFAHETQYFIDYEPPNCKENDDKKWMYILIGLIFLNA